MWFLKGMIFRSSVLNEFLRGGKLTTKGITILSKLKKDGYQLAVVVNNPQEITVYEKAGLSVYFGNFSLATISEADAANNILFRNWHLADQLELFVVTDLPGKNGLFAWAEQQNAWIIFYTSAVCFFPGKRDIAMIEDVVQILDKIPQVA
jgi:hypothetical protein